MPLDKVKQGEPLSAANYNLLVEQANKVKSITAGKGIKVKNLASGTHISLVETGRRWLGKIGTAGPSAEADYSDSRYWVKVAYVSNTGGVETEKVDVTAFDTTDTQYAVITATNLSEWIEDTHALTPDTPVFVREYFDDSTPGILKYIIEHGGASLPTPEFVMMELQGTGQNAVGYDWSRLHPMVGIAE